MHPSLTRIERFGLPVAIFLLALFLNAYRIDKSPDIHGDEIMYAQAGVNIATTGELTWLADKPVWVHPPLFFLVEGLTASVVGLDQDLFESIYALRYLSALFGALTAVLLFALIRHAFGIGAALVASLLFLFDPFVMRICRRVMLEPLMMLLTVAGMFLFYRYRGRLTWSRIALVSAAFGLALLTKELAIIGVAACLLFSLLRRKRWMKRRTVAVGALAVTVWSAYPAWSVASGNWDDFRQAKLLGVERLLGIVPTTSWKSPPISLANADRAVKHQHLQNLPRISLKDALVANLSQYASSYALIALAPFLAVYLWWRRRDEGSLFLLSWIVATGAFLGASALVGTAHVQFGYLIMPPACAILGIALVPGSSARVIRASFSLSDGLRLFVLVAILAFGAWRWGLLFGVGMDNSYHRLAQYIEAHVPHDAVINSSQPVRIEPASRWLFPNHTLTSIRDPEKLERLGVRYAILSSKDVWAGYGRMSREYVAWLRENGRRVFHSRGNTFWDLELLELSTGNPPVAARNERENQAAAPADTPL